MVRSSLAITIVSRVVAREGDEGEAGAGSSHSTRAKCIALCRCVLGGGEREVRARRGGTVVGG